jgi:hypothetical protein
LNVVEAPRDDEIAVDQDLQVGYVPGDRAVAGFVEVGVADLAYGLDADVLQRLLVFVRDDVGGDGGHQAVEVSRGGVVVPPARLRRGPDRGQGCHCAGASRTWPERTAGMRCGGEFDRLLT